MRAGEIIARRKGGENHGKEEGKRDKSVSDGGVRKGELVYVDLMLLGGSLGEPGPASS